MRGRQTPCTRSVLKDCLLAGREDMDVRMLGAGRPFALEIINARISQHPAAFFRSVEQQLDQVLAAGSLTAGRDATRGRNLAGFRAGRLRSEGT